MLQFFFMSDAFAHASSQAFVPLLPTDLYISAGVAAVGLTILLLIIPGVGDFLSSMPAVKIAQVPAWDISTLTSCLSFLLLFFLVSVGMTGSHDPLVNPLPLFIWTVFWVGLVSLHALFGNLWNWMNPWTGIYDVFIKSVNWQTPLQLPEGLKCWPAIAGFLGFTIFMIASLTPQDPSQLAVAVAVYWIMNLLGMLLFGRNEWLDNCECFTLLMKNFSRLSVFRIEERKLEVGVPGWKLKNVQMTSIIAGLFVIVVLASSSFDGLNETFWWLGVLGINPLDFPGRSAIFWQTVGGLLTFNLMMVGVFSLCVYLGLMMIEKTEHFRNVFYRLAVCVIPIAVAYHMAHFLPSFMVEIQYALAAASDPWTVGADYLGLGTFYVTTGFFNTLESIRKIFLTQVVLIVSGHCISIICAHRTMMELLQSHKKAVFSQIPLAIFMVFYTFFGLWLLASPRGA